MKIAESNNSSTLSKPRWTSLIERLRSRIFCAEFRTRHRRRDTDFVRQRLFTFPVVTLLLLQKTTRSIQRHLHTFLGQHLPGEHATPGAWTQVRAKFSHSALIELNQEVLLSEFYSRQSKTRRRNWRGHRMLGLDGSTLRLPNHRKLAQSFGTTTVTNQLGDTGTTYVPARLSVVYDLLNNLGLDGRLGPLSTGEVEMAMEQLIHVQAGDVLLWDRGFTGFPLMARVIKHGAHFVGRCSTGSFAQAQALFGANQEGVSWLIKLSAPYDQRPGLREAGLPQQMTVRFVSVRLPDGKLEVLVTSLLDQKKYPTGEFMKVYHWRWGHETYYKTLKDNLDLENWSGLTPESIYQDLQSSVLLRNLESLLTQEAQEVLSAGDHLRQHAAQINRKVSCHTLKEHILNLLWDSQQPVAKVLAKMQVWLTSNPTSVRPGRNPPRRPQSLNRSYQFQRNVRKSIF